MPIFEYKCDSCGHHFEELQKINEKPLKKCPKCKKRKLKKLISSGSFILKGSGFYQNDYKNRKTPQPKEKPKEKPDTKTWTEVNPKT